MKMAVPSLLAWKKDRAHMGVGGEGGILLMADWVKKAEKRGRQGPEETSGRGVQSYSQTGGQRYGIQSNDG